LVSPRAIPPRRRRSRLLQPWAVTGESLSVGGQRLHQDVESACPVPPRLSGMIKGSLRERSLDRSFRDRWCRCQVGVGRRDFDFLRDWTGIARPVITMPSIGRPEDRLRSVTNSLAVLLSPDNSNGPDPGIKRVAERETAAPRSRLLFQWPRRPRSRRSQDAAVPKGVGVAVRQGSPL
jgi:hypothetical protein